MKKFAAFFSALVLIIISVFADISASAATYTPDVTLYSKAYMLINMDDDSYPVVAEKNQDENTARDLLGNTCAHQLFGT